MCLAQTETCDLPKVAAKSLGSPIVVALNDFERVMGKLDYALYRGEVFKQVNTSKYTYQRCCSTKKILSLLGSNDRFNINIIKHLNKIIEILREKSANN